MAVVPGLSCTRDQAHRSKIAPRGQTPMGDAVRQGNMTRGISIRRRRRRRCRESRFGVSQGDMTGITDEDRPKKQGALAALAALVRIS